MDIMVFGEALPFIDKYVDELSKMLGKVRSGAELTRKQKIWLKFCLMGILITNSIKWSKFFRASLGKYKVSALSWMLRSSKTSWEYILQASTLAILKKYNLKKGVLVFDDTDKKRSKRTKRIYRAHKVFDKSTGGYFNGQSIVFLLLVTEKITIPVGFRFYCPKKHYKEDTVKQKTKLNLGIDLLKKFKADFPEFIVKAVLADALYGSKDFADDVDRIYPKSQFVSQLKSDQLVFSKERKVSVKRYFEKREGLKVMMRLRGREKDLEYLGARLKVASHGKKRFVVAMRYEGESEYRYIYGTRLAWRGRDIVSVYSLRWLVEVFFQDCKTFEGLRELQLLDAEGSERAVILSLLFDSSLFFHDVQFQLIEGKLSACTVGSLLEKCRVEAFTLYVKELLLSEYPMSVTEKMEEGVKSIYGLRSSTKHMVGVDLGNMEAQTNTLRYRARDEIPVSA